VDDGLLRNDWLELQTSPVPSGTEAFLESVDRVGRTRSSPPHRHRRHRAEHAVQRPRCGLRAQAGRRLGVGARPSPRPPFAGPVALHYAGNAWTELDPGGFGNLLGVTVLPTGRVVGVGTLLPEPFAVARAAPWPRLR
jgi:hypothetical protein